MTSTDPQQPSLAEVCAQELRRSGSITAAYPNPFVRDRLRHAGREAGRILNRPIRTFDAPAQEGEGGTVVIALTDWATSNPLETRLSETRANRLIDQALAEADHRT